MTSKRRTWASLGGRRRDFRARIIARDKADPFYVCPACGQPIDWELRWPHPFSPTIDHLHELQDGGDPLDSSNCAAMHAKCNQAKGARRRSQKLRTEGIIVGDLDAV